MSSHEQNKNQPEVATLQELQPAFEAIEREVYLNSDTYKEPTEIYGESYINDRHLLHVKHQPELNLVDVPAAGIVSRIPEETAALLGISAEQTLTLSFAPECYEQRGDDGGFRFQRASAQLVVTSMYPNGGAETKHYSIEIDRTKDVPKAGSHYDEMYEMEDDPIDVDTLPPGPDEADIALYGLLHQEPVETDLFADPENRRLMGERVLSGRPLTPAEAEAVEIVASRFSR